MVNSEELISNTGYLTL